MRFALPFLACAVAFSPLRAPVHRHTRLREREDGIASDTVSLGSLERFRSDPSAAPSARAPGGLACIPLSPSRPWPFAGGAGSTTLHCFDQQTMEAVRHALRHSGGQLVIAQLDAEAAAARRFALTSGVLCSVLAEQPGDPALYPRTRENKLGETSASFEVVARALRPVEVRKVAQREPFLVVETRAEDGAD